MQAQPIFHSTILTLYPEMFPGPLGMSLAGKALKEGIWDLKTLNIRDFATDKHRTVDDTPYGGGAGMVLRPDIVASAIEAGLKLAPAARLIHFSPRGRSFNQNLAQELLKTPLLLLCGHFEGIDQRVLDHYRPLEVSIGDYVLSGGEMAAMIMLDACVRLLPGVVGDPQALTEESFSNHAEYTGLLEYSQYTRPPVWNGAKVPDVLQSGNHAEIKAWRLEQAQTITRERRPDLWEKYQPGSSNKLVKKK